MRLVDDFIFTADCFDHKNLVCVPVRCSYFCCPVVCVELWFWNEAFSPVRLVTRNGHVHCHQQRRPENERLERRNIQPSLVSVLLNWDLRKNKHSFQFCLGDVMANMQCSQRGVFGFYYIFSPHLLLDCPAHITTTPKETTVVAWDPSAAETVSVVFQLICCGGSINFHLPSLSEDIENDLDPPNVKVNASTGLLEPQTAVSTPCCSTPPAITSLNTGADEFVGGVGPKAVTPLQSTANSGTDISSLTDSKMF